MWPSPDELRRHGRARRVVRLELAGGPTDVAEALAGVPGVDGFEPGETFGAWRIACTEDADPRRQLFETAVARGWTVLTLAQEEPTLEEMFVRLTTRDVIEEGDEEMDGTDVDAEETEVVAPGEPVEDDSQEVPS